MMYRLHRQLAEIYLQTLEAIHLPAYCTQVSTIWTFQSNRRYWLQRLVIANRVNRILFYLITLDK